MHKFTQEAACNAADKMTELIRRTRQLADDAGKTVREAEVHACGMDALHQCACIYAPLWGFALELQRLADGAAAEQKALMQTIGEMLDQSERSQTPT